MENQIGSRPIEAVLPKKIDGHCYYCRSQMKSKDEGKCKTCIAFSNYDPLPSVAMRMEQEEKHNVV